MSTFNLVSSVTSLVQKTDGDDDKLVTLRNFGINISNQIEKEGNTTFLVC